MNVNGILQLYILSKIFLGPISCDVTPHPDLDDHWENYKTRFNKTYNNVAEEKRRRMWEANFHAIRKHNNEFEKGIHNYTLELNHLADMSNREYVKEMIKLSKIRRRPRDEEITGVPHHNATIPDELDWREKGLVTDAYNQEDCGSCYAFAVSSCIQGQVFKTTKKVRYYSPQQLVDCSVSSGNLGCAGGSLRNTLLYLERIGGLMTESDYPYAATQKTCSFKKSKAAVRLKSWGILPPKDETALKAAVAVIGPVAVSINASPSTFQFYASGIYDDPSCTSDKVNHAMLLVGFTKTAWILKNWWTDEWGVDGYMLLARGRNKCAISNYAAYATIFPPLPTA